MLELRQLVKAVIGVAILKPHRQHAGLRIDHDNLSGVAVVNAAAHLGRVEPAPQKVIVVAHLHDAVAQAKDDRTEPRLGPSCAGRIERLLQDNGLSFLCRRPSGVTGR